MLIQDDGAGLMGLGRADERGQEVRRLPLLDACLVAFVPFEKPDCRATDALESCVCVCTLGFMHSICSFLLPSSSSFVKLPSKSVSGRDYSLSKSLGGKNHLGLAALKRGRVVT